MKTLVSTSLLVLFFSCLHGQEGDSLRSRVLEVIVVQGVQPEGDTLQNFYRANTSATTESILARMKGVTLVRRGAYGQEPVFRSLNGGQLNVTIDGMKIFGACTDKMDPVTIYIEPQNLSSLQATLGTEGLAYGSTFGGTLNMKLAQPIVGSLAVNGQAGLDYQTAANAFNYFSKANISRKQAGYRFSATYRKNQNYRAGGGQEISFSQYEKINIATAAKWALGSYDTLQVGVLFDQGWNIGFPALPMDVSQATAGIFAVSWRRVAPVLFFHNFSIKAYHNRISHAMDDRSRIPLTMYMEMPGKSETTGILAEADVLLFHEHQTLVKMEYYINRLLGEMIMYPDEGPAMYMQTAPEATRQNAGLFFSQQWRIDDKNRLLLSLRGDMTVDHLLPGLGRQQWQVFHPELSSTTYNFAKTASLIYKRKLAPNVKLEIQTGYGERNSTLNEQYGYYLFDRFDGYDYLGNPELANEHSWNAEATLQAFSEKIEWQFTPFYQTVWNYVIGDVQAGYRAMTHGAYGVKQYDNVHSARLKGADVMVLVRPLPALQGIASIKYTQGQTAEGEPMPLVPPVKAVTSIRYQQGKVHFQAEWEWAGAQKRTNTTSGEQQTPSFSVFSARTGWKLNSFLYCNAGAENIFDKRYREHLDWGGIPRSGRNIYLNLLYNFGK